MPDEQPTVTVVTGAASGIGAATARLLARPGAKLALHTRGQSQASRTALQHIAAEMHEAGADTMLLYGDLGEEGCGRRIVEVARAHFGRVDRIVANAGFSDRRATTELQRSDVDRSYAAMTGSFFEIAQAARADLETSSCGRIVLVSSFVAHAFAPGRVFPASAVAKAGAEALMRALAAELAPKRVTVNAVVPGYTRKDGGHTSINAEAWARAEAATPMGRLGEPMDVGHLIAFLLSPVARHITGQAIAVDGGLTLA